MLQYEVLYTVQYSILYGCMPSYVDMLMRMPLSTVYNIALYFYMHVASVRTRPH